MELPSHQKVESPPMEWLEAVVSTLHVHWYRTVRATTRYSYQECRCSVRRIVRIPGLGYEPLDVWWIDEKNRPKLVTPKRQ